MKNLPDRGEKLQFAAIRIVDPSSARPLRLPQPHRMPKTLKTSSSLKGEEPLRTARRHRQRRQLQSAGGGDTATNFSAAHTADVSPGPFSNLKENKIFSSHTHQVTPLEPRSVMQLVCQSIALPDWRIHGPLTARRVRARVVRAQSQSRWRKSRFWRQCVANRHNLGVFASLIGILG